MCDYCQEERHFETDSQNSCAFIEDEKGTFYLVFDNSDGSRSYGRIRIYNCPMCGRELETS